jgi:hypothetical protein
VADGTILNLGSGGDTISTDDLGTVKVQRVKVQYGADGSATDVNTTTPLPVVPPDVTATGSLTSTTSVTTGTLNGKDTTAIQITGTWVATLQFEATVDGTNYFAVNAITPSTGVLATSTTANGNWQVDVAGYLNFRVRCSAFTSGTAVVSISASSGGGAMGLDAPLPAGTNIIGALVANQSTNIAQMNGVTVTMGAGASGTGVQRVAIATDGQGQIADNAGFTDTATRLDMAGYIFDEVAGTALTENDGAAARIDSKRAQVMVFEDETTRGQRATVNSSKGLHVTPVGHTSGGLSAATGSIGATATAVKASAGQVYGWFFYNSNASVSYVQFFNTATGSTTVGTTTPVYSLGIPASSGANVMMPIGIAHSTAITIAITTTRAGSTGPGSTVDYNVFYV